MANAYPPWPGFAMPQNHSRDELEGAAGPDRQTQLEEILSHVRRCEKWARIDDRIDLERKLDGST